MRTISVMLAGAALLAAGASHAESDGKVDSRAEKAQAKLEKRLEGRVAGKPVDCLMMRSVRSSTVYNKTAIIYEAGNTLYLNVPRIGATSLDDDDILTLRTTQAQICSLDVVHLVDRTSYIQRGFVSLGEFVPYTKVKVADAQ